MTGKKGSKTTYMTIQIKRWGGNLMARGTAVDNKESRGGGGKHILFGHYKIITFLVYSKMINPGKQLHLSNMAPLVSQIIRESIYTLVTWSSILAHQRQSPLGLMIGDLLDHLAEHLLILHLELWPWVSPITSIRYDLKRLYEYMIVSTNLVHIWHGWQERKGRKLHTWQYK